MTAIRQLKPWEKATEADLFLLAKIVWICRNGQADYIVPIGMRTAALRLERAGLIQRNPTAKNIISLAREGENARDHLIGLLEGFYKR